WLVARDSQGLAGLAIFRTPRSDLDERLAGIRLATLADILYPTDRPEAGLALCGAVEDAARKSHADGIVAMASSPRCIALLRRQWHLPIGASVHFLFRNSHPASPSFGAALTEWWLQRGDGGADDAL